MCYLAQIGERKKLCHRFGKAVDLLLAECMLVQEVADMLFHLVISVLDFFGKLQTEIVFYGRESHFFL